MYAKLNSIGSRIFLWFFLAISVLLIILGFLLQQKINNIILTSIDHLLDSKMQIVTGLLEVEDHRITLELSEVIHGEYAIPKSGHYYKLVIDGKRIIASPSLGNNNFDLASGIIQKTDNIMKQTLYLSKGPAGEPIKVL